MSDSQPNEYQRLQGIAILLGIASVMLLANAFFSAAEDVSVFRRQEYLVAFLAGLMMAEPACLVVWLVLGDGGMVRRIATVMLFSTALFSAWLLGVAIFDLDTTHGIANQIYYDDYVFASFTPAVSLASAIALVVYRYLTRNQLFRHGDEVAKTNPSILGFLSVTAVIAISLAVSQLPVRWEQATAVECWTVLGVACGIAAFFGAIILLPSVLLVMRGTYWLPAIAVLATNLLFCANCLFCHQVLFNRLIGSS